MSGIVRSLPLQSWSMPSPQISAVPSPPWHALQDPAPSQVSTPMPQVPMQLRVAPLQSGSSQSTSPSQSSSMPFWQSLSRAEVAQVHEPMLQA